MKKFGDCPQVFSRFDHHRSILSDFWLPAGNQLDFYEIAVSDRTIGSEPLCFRGAVTEAKLPVQSEENYAMAWNVKPKFEALPPTGTPTFRLKPRSVTCS